MPLVGADNTDPRLIHTIQLAMLLGFVGAILFGIGSSLISCWYWALLGHHIIGNTAFGPLSLGSLITGRGLLARLPVFSV
jgi:hypothetical protein